MAARAIKPAKMPPTTAPVFVSEEAEVGGSVGTLAATAVMDARELVDKTDFVMTAVGLRVVVCTCTEDICK